MTTTTELETELHRVVDRLSSMSLVKAETCLHMVHAAAALILERTRPIDPTIPTDAQLPRVAVSGAAAQLAVIGDDYLSAVRRSPETDTSAVLDELVRLRRALP